MLNVPFSHVFKPNNMLFSHVFKKSCGKNRKVFVSWNGKSDIFLPPKPIKPYFCQININHILIRYKRKRQKDNHFDILNKR